jgi:hypothetical protein
MKEVSYLYQIIRYVSDLERMEAQNIGIVVQGEGQTVARLWKHFRPLGEKRDFDYLNFRKWREFFEEEITGAQISMFQPPRNSPQFLEYLQSRCKSNYLMSRPLRFVSQVDRVEEVRDYLYDRLVKPQNDNQELALQPVQRFREELQIKKIDKHPRFKQDEYVHLPNGDSELFKWQYEKNHGTNQRVIIEPVQWLNKIRITQIELEHVLRAAKRVRESHLNAKFIVVMDDVQPPPQNAKSSSSQLYENYMQGKETLKHITDEIVSSADESEELVNRIEADLKQLVA